jgi:hypothetical protein
VIGVLRDEWGDVVDGLQTVPGSRRVMGVVISRKFNRRNHQRRQQLLWTTLGKRLSKTDLDRLGPIAALTPADAELASSD